jgi:hypothetical protein
VRPAAGQPCSPSFCAAAACERGVPNLPPPLRCAAGRKVKLPGLIFFLPPSIAYSCESSKLVKQNQPGQISSRAPRFCPHACHSQFSPIFVRRGRDFGSAPPHRPSRRRSICMRKTGRRLVFPRAPAISGVRPRDFGNARPHRPNRRRSWGAALTKTTFGKKRGFPFLSAKKRYPQSKKTFFCS